VKVFGDGQWAFEASGDVLINWRITICSLELHYASEIESVLILDCKTIKEPMRLRDSCSQRGQSDR